MTTFVRSLVILTLGSVFVLHTSGQELHAEPIAKERTIAVIPVSVFGEPMGKTSEYRDAVEGAVHRAQKYAVLGQEEAQSRAISLAATQAPRAKSEFDELVKDLSVAEEKIFTNPAAALRMVDEILNSLRGLIGVVSKAEGFEESLFKAQMVRARALLDTGDEAGAREALLAVYRTFGTEAEVTRAQFHPSIVSVYENVLRNQAETGRLHVDSTRAGSEIHLGGRQIKLKTNTIINGLVPGTISVRTKTEAGRSREYNVVIKAGAEAKVKIDDVFETSILLHQDHVGIQAVGKWSPSKVGSHAARLGKALNVDFIVLTGVISQGGKRNLVAMLVDVSAGKVVSEKAVGVEKDVVSYKRANEVAEALGVGGAPIGTEDMGLWYEDVLGWSLAGVGVVSLIVGGVMGANYSSKASEIEASTPENYTQSQILSLKEDTESAGTGAAIASVVGGAALVSGIVVFLLHEMSPAGDSADSSLPIFHVSPRLGTHGLEGVHAGVGISF